MADSHRGQNSLADIAEDKNLSIPREHRSVTSFNLNHVQVDRTPDRGQADLGSSFVRHQFAAGQAELGRLPASGVMAPHFQASLAGRHSTQAVALIEIRESNAHRPIFQALGKTFIKFQPNRLPLGQYTCPGSKPLLFRPDINDILAVTGIARQPPHEEVVIIVEGAQPALSRRLAIGCSHGAILSEGNPGAGRRVGTGMVADILGSERERRIEFSLIRSAWLVVMDATDVVGTIDGHLHIALVQCDVRDAAV